MSRFSALSSSAAPLLPVVLTIALITVGCGGQGNVRKRAPAPDPITTANRLLANGSYAAAADAYLGLAANADERAATRYTAIAVLAYRDAGDPGAATTTLAALPATSTDPVVETAGGCMMNDAGEPTTALARLTAVSVTPLTPYQRGHYARCTARAAAATGAGETAAKNWVESWRYPMPAAERESAVAATWRALAGLEQGVLSALADGASGAGAGWYELALVTQRSQFDTSHFAELTTAWEQRHAGHPAAALVPGLLERSEALSVRPRRVALLLPFDGELGEAAQAIRDGFLSAWHQDSRNPSRPAVKIYSSSGTSVPELVQRIAADGCEFIVGPLRKDLVAALNADSELGISTLALNVTGDPSRTGFYQFGLTPEDEAVQVARHALSSGRRALLLTADTPWGERLRQAYQRTWTELGGEIVAEVPFRNDAEAYGNAVKQALGVQLSETRHAELRNTLSLPLHFEPRRREDVDVILLAGFASDAQQILPQLRYFRAGGIPVFATSHVYTGGLTAARNVDLDGIRFGDMPWLFGVVERDIHGVIRRHWPRRSDRYARLFGFGIDAYRLLPQLPRMRVQPGMRLPGVTGDLWMDNRGVVRRNITWLHVVDGIPTLLDFRTRRGAL